MTRYKITILAFSSCFFLSISNALSFVYLPVNQQDSLFITEFHNELQAIGWPELWDSSQPARTWQGIGWGPGPVGRLKNWSIRADQMGFERDSLPSLFGTLSELEEFEGLFLIGLGLKHICKDIGEISNLKNLHFGLNKLNDLPIEINNLVKLELLSLSDNNFKSLPDLSGLRALKILNVDSNHSLTDLNLPILDSLESLSASFSPIGEVPATIGNLTNLTRLSLWSCKLSNLPDELGNLKKLKELNLDGNQFIELPISFNGLTNLEVLKASFGELYIIPDLGQMISLRRVALGSNKLTEFPLSILELPNLLEIDLSENNLSGPVPEALFANNRRGINISDNNLSGEISLGAAGRVPLSIDLTGNQFELKDIDPIFSLLVSARTSFEFNPQQLIGSNEIMIPEVGEDVSVTVENYVPLSGASVEWFRLSSVGSRDAPEFVSEGIEMLIPEFDPMEDGGVFFAKVTHPNLSGLELKSEEIRVIGLNRAPTLSANNQRFRSDSIQRITVFASDDYTNYEDLSWTIPIETTHFTIDRLSTSNSEWLTLNLKDPNWLGTDSLSISVEDEQGNITTRTMRITIISEANEPPVFNPVPPIYLNFDDVIPGLSLDCDSSRIYSSLSHLETYVSDDFNSINDLSFSIDSQDTIGFLDRNIFVAVQDIGFNKTLDAFLFSCQDTSFNISFDVEVRDQEGGVSSQQIMLIYEPSNTPPQVSDVPDQLILKGTQSFEPLAISDYVTDDFLLPDQLTWDVSNQGGLMTDVEIINGTVWLNAMPAYIDSAYTDTVTIFVSETNRIFFSELKITYIITDTGYEVSGAILDSEGVPLEGVNISGFPSEVVTDGNGFYNIELPMGWSGEIQPLLEDYSFTPEVITVENLNQDELNKDFVGTFIGLYTISGTVTDGSDTPLEGVNISGLPTEVITNANGFYSIELSQGWSGEIRPTLEDYSFFPEFITIESLSEDLLNTDFISTFIGLYMVSGTVLDDSEEPLEGVDLSGFPREVTTDVNGFYSVELPAGWSGVAKPTFENYTFDPLEFSIDNLNSNLRNIDFLGVYIVPEFLVSGRVSTIDNEPMANINIEGFSEVLMTNSDGYFEAKVPLAWSGEIRPVVPENYIVEPEFITFEDVKQNQIEQNFRVTIITGSSESIESDFLSIYPNPSKKAVFISFEKPLLKNAIVSILDINGKLVQRIWVSSGTKKLEWDGNLPLGGRAPEGMYYLLISEEGESIKTGRVLLIDD
ncbi:MAG: T9SS type A sorting domain-containing protein [Bacteroidota bacterium]